MSGETEKILAARGGTHGHFPDGARRMQALKRIMRESGQTLDDPSAEGLEMILHKVGRILSGDPTHRDHWDDIAGYATLVSKHLKELEESRKKDG